VEDEVRGIAELVPAGGTCVDVGAEYGLYTVVMAAAAGPSGIVHAVEPQRTPNRVIDLVVSALGVQDRVVRHEYALGAHPGSSRLSVPIRRGRAVHGRAYVLRGAVHTGPNTEEFGADRRVPVHVSTLDALVDDLGLARLDLVKADVEGAELQVLVGGKDTIDRFRPTVQLEIEAPHLAKYGTSVGDVTGFLLDRDYAMLVWRAGGWRPAATVTSAARNYLFRPRAQPGAGSGPRGEG
jgi:FkbM family methyltransferase